jgi:SNF2 family DNA or RNA helicase
MMDLKKFTRDFDSVIRHRGENYFRQGRVQVSSLKPGREAHFQVRGSEIYQVHLKQGPHKELEMSCTCPYFQGGFYCKHLWAAILKAQEQSFFETTSLQAVKESKKKSSPEWRRALDRLKTDQKNPLESEAERRRNSPQRQGLYGIDLDRTRYLDKFNLAFFIREQRRDGSWGELKRTSVSRDDVEKYSDPLDQEALYTFLGPTPEYRYYYENPRREFIPLESVHVLPLLRELATAKKLFASDSSHGIRLLTVVEVHVELQLKINEVGNGYSLRAMLVAGTKSWPVVPQMIYHRPFLLFADTLVVADFKAFERWFELFQQDSEILIPKNDIDGFLEYYFNAPATPELELPKDFHLRHSDKIKKVRLEIDKVDGVAALNGVLHFQYGDEFLSFQDPRNKIFDAQSRTVFNRNAPYENEEFQKLSSSTAWKVSIEKKNVTLLDAALPSLIEKALEWGWEVVAFKSLVSAGETYKAVMSSGMDWFDLSVQFDFSLGQSLNLPQLLQNIKSGQRFIQLADGTTGFLHREWIRKFSELAENSEVTGDHLRLTKVQALFYGATLAENENFKPDRKFKTLQKLLFDVKASKEVPLDKAFQGKLRPYQKKGLSWLSTMMNQEIGAVLADDMGLGKTIQILALLSKERKAKTLIVAPKSLVFNWLSEARKFTPQLKFYDHVGGSRKERSQEMSQAQVIVTTYQTLRMDIEIFKDMKFDYFILDEAHYIKNAESQASMACKLIQAKKKMALSGTPVENSLADLFSILAVTTPGLISQKTAAKYARETDPEVLQRLSRSLRPFILRRTKEQVLKDLPVKSEQILYCELSASERRKYDELKKYYWSNLSGKIEEKGFERSKIEILEALLRLRQASCHLGLLSPQGAKASSAKFELLLEQLETALAEGHKVLVFSQFTTLLHLLESTLREKKIKYEYLDGQTVNRAERVRNFQENKEVAVFLVSLKAGGVGLNLTAASYVYILDPWWNPAAEAQAIDRAHRIGQKNKVFAYKLIAKDTVEEKILALQETKRKLAKAVVSSDQGLLRGLKIEDLRELFS